MMFEDERYIRFFVRDTRRWIGWPWQARAVVGLVMRKLDRMGTVELGDEDGWSWEGLADLVRLPVEVVAVGMDAMVADRTFVTKACDGTAVLVMPKFHAAQEFAKTNAERAKEYRDKKREKVLAQPTSSRPSVTIRRDERDAARPGTGDVAQATVRTVTKERDEPSKSPQKRSIVTAVTPPARARVRSRPNLPNLPNRDEPNPAAASAPSATPSRSGKALRETNRADWRALDSPDWIDLTREAEALALTEPFAQFEAGDRLELARASILQKRGRTELASANGTRMSASSSPKTLATVAAASFEKVPSREEKKA